jgi:hypothetical protein
MVRAIGNPASRVAPAVQVAAVGGPQLSRQDDGADEGEEKCEDIDGKEGNGDEYRRDDAGSESVENGNPRENGNEHGQVDGAHVAVDILSDDIADESGDDDGPKKGHEADCEACNFHGGGCKMMISLKLFGVFGNDLATR